MLALKLRVLKQIDRVVGSYLVRHIAPTPRALPAPAPDGQPRPAWHPPPVPPEGIRRILVIRPGGIGDAVLTFPMIRVLKAHFVEADVDVLGEKRNTGVYRINDLVRDVFQYDARFLTTLRRLADTSYQIVVDTEQYHHLSSVVANHLGPEYLCGFDTLGRGRFQTHRVRYLEQIYEIHSFLSLANALTGRNEHFDADRPFIQVDPQWQTWARQTLADIGDRPVAALVPGASTHHKYWPPDRYAAVARWLVERGYFIVILGGNDANTCAAARTIAETNGRTDLLDLAGKTSLPQTAGLVQHADLYVSADTGPLHIAFGVGTPTVHMFGSGIIEKWAPPGKKYVVVNKHLPCSPCTRYGYTPPCPYNAACMDAITVEDVQAAIQEVLHP